MEIRAKRTVLAVFFMFAAVFCFSGEVLGSHSSSLTDEFVCDKGDRYFDPLVCVASSAGKAYSELTERREKNAALVAEVKKLQNKLAVLQKNNGALAKENQALKAGATAVEKLKKENAALAAALSQEKNKLLGAAEEIKKREDAFLNMVIILSLLLLMVFVIMYLYSSHLKGIIAALVRAGNAPAEKSPEVNYNGVILKPSDEGILASASDGSVTLVLGLYCDGFGRHGHARIKTKNLGEHLELHRRSPAHFK